MKRSILFSAILALGILFSLPSSAHSTNSQGNPPSWSGAQSGLSMQVVTKVLRKAKTHFQVSMGTLVSGYCSGACKVEKVGVTGTGDRLYKVEFGGGQVLIDIDIAG